MAAGQYRPLWEVETQSAWVSPGKRLQVTVPGCKKGNFLSIDFQTLSGFDVDFDVMLEQPDGSAVRIYGPARRVKRVDAVIELPSDGEAYVTWDNINSWFQHKHVAYKLVTTDSAPRAVSSQSTLRGGASVVHTPNAALDDAPEAAPDTPTTATVSLYVAAGSSEEVAIPVVRGNKLCVSFEVEGGRDVGFGVTLVPNDSDLGPVILYGPSPRATKLSLSMVCQVRASRAPSPPFPASSLLA